MALDIYFKEDIRNVLCAVDFAGTQRQPLPEDNSETGDYDIAFRAGFNAGFEKALIAVGFAFGIVPVESKARFVSRE